MRRIRRTRRERAEREEGTGDTHRAALEIETQIAARALFCKSRN